MASLLEGIRVVDWTIWNAGSTAGALLGDLGAQVIKIEPKEGDPLRGSRRASGVNTKLKATGSSTSWEFFNRNKHTR